MPGFGAGANDWVSSSSLARQGCHTASAQVCVPFQQALTPLAWTKVTVQLLVAPSMHASPGASSGLAPPCDVSSQRGGCASSEPEQPTKTASESATSSIST